MDSLTMEAKATKYIKYFSVISSTCMRLQYDRINNSILISCSYLRVLVFNSGMVYAFQQKQKKNSVRLRPLNSIIKLVPWLVVHLDLEIITVIIGNGKPGISVIVYYIFYWTKFLSKLVWRKTLQTSHIFLFWVWILKI